MVHKKTTVWYALVALLTAADIPLGSDAAAPSEPGAVVKTGEVDLTFTERSPISSRKEIGRRLSLKESAMGDDYDLATRPFKAYIPKNYDSGTPVGVFVYLGYKDSVSVATPWEAALDKAHMIFITPVCHNGDHHPNSVPLWQMMGLSFDAAHNLKHLYNIDETRIYRMAWNDGSMQTALASSDVFTGSLVTMDAFYFQRLVKPDKKAIYPAAFPPPLNELLQSARPRAFVMINEDFSAKDGRPAMVAAALKGIGFTHLLPLKLSTGSDLHYPDFKPEWFEQTALPFLDGASTTPAQATVAKSKTGVSTASKADSPPAAAPISASADAQHLLSLAQLYIKNGQTKLARAKLQLIMQYYPTDPAAVTAKQLLATMPGE